MPIEKFHSIEQLFDQIKNDQSSNRISDNRFPIRFIFINSFKELRELVNFFSKDNTDIKDISTCLPNENSWLTPSDVIEYIKDLNNDSTILPLSEFLRFLDPNSFLAIINSLTEIERQEKRFYIPLVGLWERFEKEFWRNFHRKLEWAPIWKLETPARKLHIFQINYNLDINNIPLKNFELVKSTNDWFNIWKKENVKGIISLSKSLSFFYGNCLPNQTFYLEDISNPKEYIKKIFDIELSIIFKEYERKYWNKLIEEIIKYDKKGITIKEIILEHFNLGSIDSITTNKFLSLYLETNNQYEHWLIRNFIISIDKYKSTYLYKCFKNLDHLESQNLAEQLWIEIFNFLPTYDPQDIFTERKSLLKVLNEYKFSSNENKLQNKLQNIKELSFKKQSLYLTNISIIEKKFILESIKSEDISHIIQDLKIVYPELYYYLDWNLIKPDQKIDDWIIEYFKSYNISKIKNCKISKIEDLLNIHNSNKSKFSEWYYSIPTPNLDTYPNCIWIDGLGAEWFPLIVHLIKEYGLVKGKSITKKIIAKVNIPTTTSCNKYNFDKIEDLDNYVHKQKGYKHPNTLIEEIDIIKQIIINILNKPIEKIAFTSDHGLSFMCIKEFGNSKKLVFGDSKHEGRYMWTNKDTYSEDSYYIPWKVDNGNCKDKQAIVALKHVSLNNVPPREVHGGATPEEVLVPFILIETKKDKIEYLIEPDEFNISTSNPIIEFKISPPPDVPQAFIEERELNLEFDSNNFVYKLGLKGLNSGEHTIKVKIGYKFFELKVNVKGGFKEIDLI